MPSDISLSFGIDCRCVKCGRERELEGRHILRDDRPSGSTYIARAKSACSCGEDRIRIRIDLGG